MSIEEEIETDRKRLLKYTKEYDPEYVKVNLDIAPCNIWAYIQDLEARIAKLEEKEVK